MGSLNPFFGVGPGIKALDLAAELADIKIYVYDVATFSLVQKKPFRSMRAASTTMSISRSTLTKKMDTNKPIKGYYYFYTPQFAQPK